MILAYVWTQFSAEFFYLLIFFLKLNSFLELLIKANTINCLLGYYVLLFNAYLRGYVWALLQ